MNKQTIEENINRKIKRLLEEGLSAGDIAQRCTATNNSFKELMRVDTNSSQRNEMMGMYVEIMEDRIQELTILNKIKNDTGNN